MAFKTPSSARLLRAFFFAGACSARGFFIVRAGNKKHRIVGQKSFQSTLPNAQSNIFPTVCFFAI
jgi:hypothetical protein